ncbi:MAG: VCBS repeat-containing protein [Bifidobacteriaceae bacterium]|jgi:hypothetical protein|nr:VCBS repeat-containing protein [Bifidobacteriaceae bacterium]
MSRAQRVTGLLVAALVSLGGLALPAQAGPDLSTDADPGVAVGVNGAADDPTGLDEEDGAGDQGAPAVADPLISQVTAEADGQEENTELGCPVTQITLTPDLTGDARGEILMKLSNGDLWAYPSTGAGTFGARGRLGAGFDGHQVFAPGDWDGDTLNDIITIDQAGDMWLHGGTATGVLRAPVKIGNGWSGLRVIPVGDTTRDGNVDLLTIDSAGDLRLYAGAGGGAFKHPYPKVGWGWTGFQLLAGGDLNKDGIADILGIDPKGDLYIYRGIGSGLFQTKNKVGNGWSDFSLYAGADLNGDGIADIAGRNEATAELYYYRGLGSGMFATKKLVGGGWDGFTTCPEPVPVKTAPISYPILARYNASGGAAKMGAAATFMRCGYPDGGCFQEFTNGTIYGRTSDGLSSMTNHRGKFGRLVAVGQTQIGYTARSSAYSVTNTKYNAWVNFGGPWCHMYQEWVADRAGLGYITGWYGPYFRYQDHLRATMTKISKPQVGAYLLMSVSHTYSHTGLITWVSADSSKFTILEGNWGRAVRQSTITRSERAPQEYWMPKY